MRHERVVSAADADGFLRAGQGNSGLPCGTGAGDGSGDGRGSLLGHIYRFTYGRGTGDGEPAWPDGFGDGSSVMLLVDTGYAHNNGEGFGDGSACCLSLERRP